MQLIEGLAAEQIRLEEEAHGLGVERYRKEIGKDQAATPPGRRLLRLAVERMVPVLEERIEHLLRSGANRSVWIAYFLLQFKAGTDLLALATATTCIKEMCVSEEEDSSHNRAVQTVAIDLAQDLESTLNYEALEKADPELYRRLVRRAERTGHARSQRALLQQHQTQAGIAPIKWSESELAHVGLWLVGAFCESTGMATVETVSVRPKNGRPASKTILKPTDMVKRQLQEEHEKAAFLRPRLFPMIVPPRDWSTPFDGGYFTNALKKVAVKRAHPQYLRDMQETILAYPDGGLRNVYAAVNTLQRTAWTVNLDVYGVLDKAWNSGMEIAGLPKKEETPLPARIADPEAHPAENQARRLAAAKAHRKNEELRNARRDVDGNLSMAKRMREYSRFWFVYTMDRRGRLYAASDYLSPQGTDASKALLRFADGVALGESGRFWLAVHGANCYGNGVDKKPFDERVQWARDKEREIIASAVAPLDHSSWANADAPWQFLAFAKEWERLHAWVHSGHAEADFISHLPVSVDGTCNGLQHLSMLMRDEVGGAATNLVPNEIPQDIYQMVADEANRLLGAKKVSRKMAKRPTMTLPYGSTQLGTRNQLLEAIRAELLDEDPYEVAKTLAPVVRQATKNVVIKAVAAMDWLREVARLFAKDDIPVWWTAPSGFMVMHRYGKVTGKKIDVRIAGKRRQLMLSIEGTTLDKRRQVRAIVANYVHSLDAAHLVRTVNYARTAGVMAFAMVHDSYGTHAGKMGVLAHELRRAFVAQYSKRNVGLGKLPDEALYELEMEGPSSAMPKPPDLGDLEPTRVMASKYFFS